MPIVSHRKKFIFVSNPKAASTSIESVLAVYQDLPGLNDVARSGYFSRRHLPAVEVSRAVGARIWSSYFTFGVVRHPFEWIASIVAYDAVRNGYEAPTDRLINTEDVRAVYDRLVAYRAVPYSATAAQSAYLCDLRGSACVDSVIAVEQLSDCWPSLLARLQIDYVRLPKLNRTSHPPASAWLSDSAKRMIQQFWAGDFRLYDSARRAGRAQIR